MTYHKLGIKFMNEQKPISNIACLGISPISRAVQRGSQRSSGTRWSARRCQNPRGHDGQHSSCRCRIQSRVESSGSFGIPQTRCSVAYNRFNSDEHTIVQVSRYFHPVRQAGSLRRYGGSGSGRRYDQCHGD